MASCPGTPCAGAFALCGREHPVCGSAAGTARRARWLVSRPGGAYASGCSAGFGRAFEPAAMNGKTKPAVFLSRECRNHPRLPRGPICRISSESLAGAIHAGDAGGIEQKSRAWKPGKADLREMSILRARAKMASHFAAGSQAHDWGACILSDGRQHTQLRNQQK